MPTKTKINSEELRRLKSLVRRFLRVISGVPFRAIECDQMQAYELWDQLWDATKRQKP